MAANVKIRMSGQPEQLVAAQDAVIRNQEKVINQLRKTSGEARKGGQAAKGMSRNFLTVGRSIATALGAGSAAFLAVAAIRAEFEKVTQLQKLAAGVATELAGQRFGVLTALPEQITERGPEFIEELKKQAQAAGPIKGKELQEALTAAGSSLAAGSAELFESAITEAARISGRTTAEDAPLFAAASLKIADIVKTENAKVLLGTIFAAGRGTPITDPATQAQNIPRALALIAASDPAAETSMELFSVLAQFTKDPTGLRTGTVGANIAQRVRTRELPVGPGGEDVLLPPEIAAGGTLEALEFIREQIDQLDLSRVELTEVITTLSEGVRGKAFLQKFFAREAGVEALVAGARESFKPLDTPEGKAIVLAEFESVMTRLDEDPQVRQLVLQRRGQVAVERILEAQPGAATRGIVQQQLQDILSVIPDVSALRTRFAGIAQRLDRPGAPQKALELLEAEQVRLAKPLEEKRPGVFRLPEESVKGALSRFIGDDIVLLISKQQAEQRLAIAEALMPLIEALRESVEEIRKNREAVGVAPGAAESPAAQEQNQPLVDALDRNTQATQGKGGAPDTAALLTSQGGE